MIDSKHLPGIHILGADNVSAPSVGDLSLCQSSESVSATDVALPWGYIFIQHMSASVFERQLAARSTDGQFCPRCFIHRTVRYMRKSGQRGVKKDYKPTVSGLVFLQGTTRQLKTFLIHNFPQYYLVNNCSTGQPASIPDNVMRPFMRVMNTQPERVTFLRDPFVKFAKGRVKLRVLTGILAGQEGYIVRILKNRQLVMNLGGYAVAINDVHNEDFEVVEQ